MSLNEKTITVDGEEISYEQILAKAFNMAESSRLYNGNSNEFRLMCAQGSQAFTALARELREGVAHEMDYAIQESIMLQSLQRPYPHVPRETIHIQPELPLEDQ